MIIDSFSSQLYITSLHYTLLNFFRVLTNLLQIYVQFLSILFNPTDYSVFSAGKGRGIHQEKLRRWIFYYVHYQRMKQIFTWLQYFRYWKNARCINEKV